MSPNRSGYEIIKCQTTIHPTYSVNIFNRVSVLYNPVRAWTHFIYTTPYLKNTQVKRESMPNGKFAYLKGSVSILFIAIKEKDAVQMHQICFVVW